MPCKKDDHASRAVKPSIGQIRRPRRLGLAAACLAAGLAALAPLARAVQFGANGHFWYTAASLDQQMQLLQQMGMTQYRIDVHDTTEFGQLQAVINAAGQYGITVLPDLMSNSLQLSRDRDSQVETTATAYQKCYALAVAYATQFKGQIHAWEMGDEYEATALAYSGDTLDQPITTAGPTPIYVWPDNWGDPGGESPNDYVASRFNLVQAALQGYADGIASVDSSATRLVNATGSHYGFLQRLNANGIVHYEVTGYHIYTTDQQGGILETGDQYGSYLQNVAALGKPIWLTEYNRVQGSGDGNEAADATVLGKMTQELVSSGAQYNVQKAYVYELLDETPPTPGATSTYEAHMGMWHVVTETNLPLDVNGNYVEALGTPKPCVAAVTAAIAGAASGAPGAPTAAAPIPSSNAPSGTQLADATSGFSGTDGANGWSYGFFYGSSVSLQPMTFNGTIWTGPYSWLQVEQTDQHPSVDGLNQISAVRRWTSNTSGTVHIFGQFSIGHDGDGTGVTVLINGQPVVARTLIGNSSNIEVLPFDFTWNISPGDTVDFAVDPGPGRDINYDATALSATITAQ